MGAVKTNRREKALSWTNNAEKRYGGVQKYDRLYKRDERLWIYYLPGAGEPNNRRKMAGLPLIRRAKS
jgi:hypothetical protein